MTVCCRCNVRLDGNPGAMMLELTVHDHTGRASRVCKRCWVENSSKPQLKDVRPGAGRRRTGA